MAYLNEDGLARYDGLIKNWVTLKSGTVDGVDPLLNWQKTDTAGAVTCYPLPAAPIDPTVNFLFTETGPASGTKSPDNPSTIAGVTQAKVTRCGKNIIKLPFYDRIKTVNGVTFIADNATGTVTVNSDGPATANSSFYLMPNGNAKLFAGENYFLSGCPAGGSVSTYYLGGSRYSFGGDYITTVSPDVGSGSSLSFNSDWTLNCIIRIVAGTTVSNLVFKPQLELGSTATSFEPYAGTDYTVNLGGTYYGGTVDIATGVMTVTHQAVTPNIETVDISSAPAALPLDYADTFGRSITSADGTSLSVGSAGGTVVYKLATPYTVPLTPTQIYSLSQPDPYVPRTNTVYSDQTSVQVGYPKSPQATSTELTNAIISLGGNV